MSPALMADIRRQMEEAVAKRLAAYAISQQVRTIKEKALRDAGVKLNPVAWER